VRRLAFGVWRLAFGVWRLAFGVWRSAFGVRRLAFGVRRSAFAVERSRLALGVGRDGINGMTGFLRPTAQEISQQQTVNGELRTPSTQKAAGGLDRG
jgi:hypothetical protein